MRCHGDYHFCGVAFGVKQRVLGRSVGYGVGLDEELASYPFGYRVLLDLDFGVLDAVEGLLLACGLCYTCGVFSVSVGTVRSEVVTYLFRFLRLGLWLGLRCRRLFSRVASGGYSPEKTATMAIGSPVATMLMVVAVWPLLHFTKFLPVFGVAVSVRVVPLATSVPLSMVS